MNNFKDLFENSDMNSDIVNFFKNPKFTELEMGGDNYESIQATWDSGQNIGTHWYYFSDSKALVKLSGTRGKIKIRLVKHKSNNYGKKGIEIEPGYLETLGKTIHEVER